MTQSKPKKENIFYHFPLQLNVQRTLIVRIFTICERLCFHSLVNIFIYSYLKKNEKKNNPKPAK